MSLNTLAKVLHRLSAMKVGSAMVMAIAVTLLFVTLRPAFPAGETVPLQDGRLRIDLASYALVYADPTRQLSIADIAADAFETNLKPVDGRLIDFGFTDARIWTKFRLRNAADATGVWRISHEINVMHVFKVHHLRTDGSGQQSIQTILTLTGESTFAQRAVSHRLPASDVRLAPGEEVVIFIEYETGQATQMPLFVETIGSFNERVRFEDLIIIAPLAFAAGMAIISTLYLAALGMRAAILYGTYILLATLHLFHADGYAFQYLWPNFPQWNAIAMGPIGISIGCFGSFFTWAFIEARKHHPFFAMALPATGLLAALFAVGFPWFVDEKWFKVGTLVLVFWVSILNLAAAIASYRRKHVGSTVFLLGMISVTSAMALTVVGYGFPGQFNQDTTGHFGRLVLVFEGVVFSLAIFMRTLAMRSHHDDTLLARIRLGDEKLQLSEALRSAEQSYQQVSALASRDREVFASAAHDIRQPLTSLRMALLKMSNQNPATAKQVKESFDYLDDLVTSNLDRVRPEVDGQVMAGDGNGHGAEPDREETFQLSVVLKNVDAMFGAEARAKGLDFRIACPDLQIVTRPLELLRVLTNLVSNAVKYTNEGGVFVGYKIDADTVLLFVADTGRGMEQTQVGNLVKPYTQGDCADGYGLGLSVTHKLCVENAYELRFQSASGRGTIASIRLPLAAGANRTPDAEKTALPITVPGE